LWNSTLKAAEKLPDGGACYTKDEVTKLADTINAYHVCESEARLQREYIDKSMADFASAGSVRWWQDPTVIVSGVVVSFSVGALAAGLMLRSK
jgi:hypothetical protein